MKTFNWVIVEVLDRTRIVLTEDSDTAPDFHKFLQNLKDAEVEYTLHKPDSGPDTFLKLDRSEEELHRVEELLNKYYPESEAEFG